MERYDKDPWEWTISEVSAWIRNDLRHLADAIPNALLPDIETLALSFEEQEISGHALLSDISPGFLKLECEVKAHGRRSTILGAIRLLQRQSAAHASHNMSFRGRDGMSQSFGTPTSQTIKSVESPAQVPRTRKREVLVEDATGRKRRKLDLNARALLEQPQSKSREEMLTGSMDSSCLPQTKLTINEIIYGSTALAQPTPTLTVGKSGEDLEEFTFTSHPATHASRRYVYRQMQHMFQNANIQTVTYRGGARAGLVLYRKNLLPQGTPQSLTLLPRPDSDEQAIRVDETMLTDETANPIRDVGDEWDFLARKYAVQPGDVTLPLYAESESISDNSSLFAEIEEERREREEYEHGKLAKAAVDSVIASVIEDYVHVWKETKRPRLEERSAYKIWRQGRDSLVRGRLVRMQNSNLIRHLRTRLEKMRHDLLAQEWRTRKELERQCVILQPSTYDLEEQLWKEAVYNRPLPPQRPDAVKRPKNAAASGPATSAEVDSDIINDQAQYDPESRERIVDDDMNLTNSLPSAKDLEKDGSEAVEDPMNIDQDAEPDAKSIITVESDGNDNEHLAVHSDDSQSLFSIPVPRSVRRPQSASNGSRSHSRARTTMTLDDTIEISSNESESCSAEEDSAPTKIQIFKGDPTFAQRRQIIGWKYNDLMLRMDRKRLLLKFIESLEQSIKDEMMEELSCHTPAHKWLEASIAEVLRQRSKTQSPINGSSLNTVIQRFARLYSCWYNCNPTFWDRPLPEDLWIPNIDEADLADWAEFMEIELPRIAGFTGDSLVHETIVIESDAEDVIPRSQKRRRKLKKDARAQKTRENAQVRMKRFEESQHDSQAVAITVVSPGSENIEDRIVVNIVRDEDEEAVFLNPDIARRLKNHQIDGVRFLWREVTAGREENGQGCVLAHTMGLGKTCQAVTFLVTLKEATKNRSTRSLVPRELRKLRALILCPPAILQNWIREIELWSPRAEMFDVSKIDSTGNDQHERLAVLRHWHSSEGILLIGYSMFLSLIKAGDKAKTGTPPGHSPRPSRRLSRDEDIEAAGILLGSATVVIADEAHHLRNDKSGISLAVGRIRVHRRIALTGTPMSNETQEIFSLINWVAPNFLGSSAEFRHRLAIPIEEGLYADSDAVQKRRSTKKLAVLNTEIAPKINRADITVLKGALPTMTEFVLKVPLTDLQHRLYEKYVQFVSGGIEEQTKVAQVRLFGWISILNLLCNHPKAFRNKLLEDKKPMRDARAKGSATESDELSSIDDDTDVLSADDIHISKLGLKPEMIQELAGEISETASVDASHRMILVEKILKLSRDAGDKVLIFSHSIPTLDCMGELLNSLGVRWERIDGSKSMQKREGSLSNFQQGYLDVLLVSTRAGGQGLNMQNANRVIIIDFGFNPTWEVQAIGRAYRLGQKKDVFVYRFLAGGTYEDRLYNTGIFKKNLFERIVDKKSYQRQAQRNVKDWLFPPKPVPQGDIESERGKDPAVLDKIIAQQESGARDFCIRSIKTMETLQKDPEDEPLNEEERQEVEMETAQMKLWRQKPTTAGLGSLRVSTGLPTPTTGQAPSSTAPAIQQSSLQQAVQRTELLFLLDRHMQALR
ncbi:hypothetical protein ANO11243_048040 [Dothideomycetidae sp. 11243]|nr:hypothetical protein ANO11243_048040 [fungal sp. No.11243]